MGKDKSGSVQCKVRNNRGQGTARQGKAREGRGHPRHFMGQGKEMQRPRQGRS
jgi:hypothetical protein